MKNLRSARTKKEVMRPEYPAAQPPQYDGPAGPEPELDAPGGTGSRRDRPAAATGVVVETPGAGGSVDEEPTKSAAAVGSGGMDRDMNG